MWAAFPAKKSQGLKKVHNLWAREADHAGIKVYADALSSQDQIEQVDSMKFNPELWEPVKNWLFFGGNPPDWAKRDDGLYLAIDGMTVYISPTNVEQTFYYKEKVFFTKITGRASIDFQEYFFGAPVWMKVNLPL